MNVTHNNLARQMAPSQRKTIALQAINSNITEIAAANQVSRRFVYQQKDKAIQGINDAFTDTDQHKVLFYLPITIAWIKGFVLCLLLHCRANYRGIQNVLEDNFDYSMSLGTIHNLVAETETLANKHNLAQDLSGVTLGANDELFHQNKPILTGIDIPSLYCYLLSQENNRDGDTWAINLLDLQKQGYKPERVIADDGDGLRSGHKMILHNIPCDYDNFHLSRNMMDVRRYFRNRVKSLKTDRLEFSKKAEYSSKKATRDKYERLLPAIEKELNFMSELSPTIDTLISWMEHDVLKMPGVQMKERKELFDFIMGEFEKLAELHPHRLHSICTKLRKQREGLLAFVDVLDCKFYDIAQKHKCSIEQVWQICILQRCEYYGDTYHSRSLKLLAEIGEEHFELIEDDVLAALDSTERTSSMVENLNSRVNAYLHNRKECNQIFLNLLRFYFNHTPFRRSARATRVNKTPTEILTGKKHVHWLEVLGYSKFKHLAA